MRRLGGFRRPPDRTSIAGSLKVAAEEMAMESAFQSPLKREEVTTVRKVVTAMLVTCVLSLLFTAAPAVSGTSSELEPIRCLADMAFNEWSPGDWYWTGPIYGCSIAGTMKIRELPAVFPGRTEHFFEEFQITTDAGAISGADSGVWSFVTYKFRANGWVTQGAGDLAYLLGYKVHLMGVSSPWPGNLPITATGVEVTFVAPD